ncbi:hypothetical protein K9M78_07580 [Candidatus Bipolaricaulota bacterium]|nr:hypothetical protein [Candidatus Bipolaricaulota bacterium]
MYSPEDADIGVIIFDRSYEDTLDMCGGLTQVLGYSLIETNLNRYFGVPIGNTTTKFVLKQKLGKIPITLYMKGGELAEVRTDMSRFADHSYKTGVQRVDLDGMSATKVGSFLVVEGGN